MHAARRLSGMTESIIREMTRVAMQHDAINMAQGFPDFDPPPEVLAAAVEAIQSGHNQYTITWGAASLREAIAQKYARWYAMPVDPETEITVTCGVTEAIVAALLGVIDPGDRVIVLEPAHENYLPGIIFAGGEPVWVPLAPPDFRLDEERLRDAFKQDAKAIIVNTPHNPTGRVFNRETLELIASLCVAHDVIAITDEIYEHIIYDERRHIPLATLPGMAGRTITTSGLSKTYAATGWRIAWVIAPPDLSNAVRTVKDYLTICAPTPLQHGAVAALNMPASFYDEVARSYTTRRQRMMTILDRSGFKAAPPEGAYYVLADFSAIRPDLDAMAFSHWLAAEKKVAVVPGDSFYHDPALGQSLVRFAFPKDLATLDIVEKRLKGL